MSFKVRFGKQHIPYVCTELRDDRTTRSRSREKRRQRQWIEQVYWESDEWKAKNFWFAKKPNCGDYCTKVCFVWMMWNSLYIYFANWILCSTSPYESGLSSSNAATLAKALLHIIQTQPLFSVAEYCRRHPQGENESGLSRLDSIARYEALPWYLSSYTYTELHTLINTRYYNRYKCIFALRELCLKKGEKVSKFFGISYFHWTKCWPSIKEKTLQYIADTNKSISSDETNIFLDIYEAALNGTTITAATDYSSLIWAKDFNAALHERHKRRSAEAAQRVSEYEKH